MSKLAVINEKTGEVKEYSVASPFRSLTDLQDYSDGETYEEGTSTTTLEGYEPLESIVARCMRTVRSPNGSEYQVLDTDALKAEETQQGIYEAGSASNVDEAFATLDPTDSQGFDLADASAIAGMINADVEEKSNLSTERANEAQSKAKVSDGTVGKSDDSSSTSPNSADFPEVGK